jgi:putative heme-binding domain-containing protein
LDKDVFAMRSFALALLAAALAAACSPPAAAQQRAAHEAQWIWAPLNEGQANTGAWYFRKSFRLQEPQRGRVAIACDDRYELFVNGRRVGTGDDWRTMRSYDISRLLVEGRNAIAVRVENDSPESAGLVARVTIRETGGTDVAYSTDGTWKVARRQFDNWQRASFDDARWARPQVLGEFGRTAPWSDDVAGAGGGQAGRFVLPRQFRVEVVVPPEDTGSLIALDFNEWGDLVASTEGGPIVVLHDGDRDGLPDTKVALTEELKNCQGLLALNGYIFAVGEGSQGPGLYRLTDADQDGVAEKVERLLAFRSKLLEHGPHAVVLGPDGMLYVLLGNHAQLDTLPEATSPLHHVYEGDLVQPRYEDAGGHAVGIKAPGSTVVRTDVDGSYVEVFAGGLRNPYDIVFSRQGELFTFDSDMEWDIGLPWYRPCRVNHLVPGADCGWRSGWAKWPDYYIDGTPSTLDVGRGSPTGLVCYGHHKYPPRYQNAIFAGDWSQGQILAITLQPAGGSYAASAEIFVQGQPLNVTDLAVGPDGWLYFCTGGRGTEGGIYRVVYTGAVPERAAVTGVLRAVRQPQVDSAWGREQVATVKEEMGPQWDDDLLALVADPATWPEDRLAGMRLLQLSGPVPDAELLLALSQEDSTELRACAADLMGLHADKATNERLVEMLDDADHLVRRRVCEALVRAGHQAPAAKLVERLADDDRFVAFAARRALEAQSADSWRDLVLEERDANAFLMGSVALLTEAPDRESALAVVDRGLELMDGFLSDDDFLDLLRVLQLALLRGELQPDDVPELRTRVAEEYPSLESRINRELVRLMTYLGSEGAADRLVEELHGKAPLPERIHLAAHARFLGRDWDTEQKLALLEFYEAARAQEGGHSYGLYLGNFSRDFVQTLTGEERSRVLARARELPSAALGVLAGLPEVPGRELLDKLIELDGELAAADSDAVKQLRVGILAVLGGSRDPAAMLHLREVFESAPDRRPSVAMALAQSPGGENWPLLVRALPVLEGPAAIEVLNGLAGTNQKPDAPEPLRQAIIAGLRLGEGGSPAVELLEHWTGEQHGAADDAAAALAAWQGWFRETYPDQPGPSLPEAVAGNPWDLMDLIDYLAGDGATAGDAHRGREVYQRAQCAKCHRFAGRGEGIGPDLTTISRRFHTREILESVLFPSQVISDQYAAKTVQTSRGQTYTGMVAPAGDGVIAVLQSNGEKVLLDQAEIEETAPSSKSAMPEGLFNALTQEDIADLFAYLKTGGAATVARPPARRDPPEE